MTPYPSLLKIKSDSFLEAYAYIATPTALYRVLGRSDEVKAVRDAHQSGVVSHKAIRTFVDSLLDKLKAGEPFKYDLTTAALAVVLETSNSSFADEYLNDLGKLKLAEMPMSIRVARECLRNRVNLAKTAVNTKTIQSVSFASLSYADWSLEYRGDETREIVGKHTCGA